MMGSLMYKYLLLLSCCAFPIPAHAQDQVDEVPFETDPLADAPGHHGSNPIEPVITVTANGLSTNIDSTGQPVTIIQRAEIEAVQGADLARTLRRAPGITLTRNGPVGSFSGIAVRGASADQLLVVIDGVRVADPAAPAGGFDSGNLLSGNVGTLDLLRGSNSVIWGADAVGGVLAVSTRAETDLTGSIEYGSRNTLFATASGGLKGDKYYAGLSASYYDSSGFSAAEAGSERDGFEQFALTGSAFYDLTSTIELFASGRYSQGKLEIDGFPAPTFTLADTPEVQDTEQFSGAIGASYYGQDLTLRASYSLSDTERDNFTDGSRDVMGFASNGRSERFDLRAEARLIGGLTLAYGGEYEETRFDTSFAGFSGENAETSIVGGYAQAGWVLGKLAAHLGARYDNHQDFGGQVSFGGDVSYGFNRDWRARASFGEGFKPPSLFQLLSGFGNANLQPETSTSVDLGVERGTRGRGTHLALTVFRRDSDDLIDFVSCFTIVSAICTDRPFGTYDNVGQARAQGVEVEAGGNLSRNLRLAGQYSFIGTENRTSGASMQGNDLARRPRHAATIFSDWTSNFGLTLGADLRFVGSSFDDAGNQVRLDKHAVLDLRASYTLADKLSVFGRVENVWDEDYQTAAGYASAGRGVFVGIKAGL